jgi:hypothetical protein
MVDDTTVTLTLRFEDVSPEAFRKAKEQIGALIQRGLTQSPKQDK